MEKVYALPLPLIPPLLACCWGKWLSCPYALTPPPCGCYKVNFSEVTKMFLKCLALKATTSQNCLLQIYKIHSAGQLISLFQVVSTLPDEVMSVNDLTGWGQGFTIT